MSYSHLYQRCRIHEYSSTKITNSSSPTLTLTRPLRSNFHTHTHTHICREIDGDWYVVKQFQDAVPHTFIIARVRVKANDAVTGKPSERVMSVYYLVNGTVYMAPDLYSLLHSKLATSCHSLHQALEKFRSSLVFDPLAPGSAGAMYVPKSTSQPQSGPASVVSFPRYSKARQKVSEMMHVYEKATVQALIKKQMQREQEDREKEVQQQQQIQHQEKEGNTETPNLIDVATSSASSQPQSAQQTLGKRQRGSVSDSLDDVSGENPALKRSKH